VSGVRERLKRFDISNLIMMMSTSLKCLFLLQPHYLAYNFGLSSCHNVQPCRFFKLCNKPEILRFI